MIIHAPRVVEDAGEVCVSAEIEFDNDRSDVPRELWFRFPQSYRPHVSDRADGFLVGLLPTAMTLGESVTVEGVVSPRLAHGLREYQQIQHAWWPNRFSMVDIAYQNLGEPARPHANGAVGCTCSGGIDSLYTLWKHRPDNEPLSGYRLTHALVINGFDFDVDLDNTGYFRRLFDYYEPMMKAAGVELVMSRNNLRTFRLLGQGRAPLFLSLESPIAASVLVLGGLFARFYIPGSDSYRYESMIPKGAHPVFVHLLGTETLQMISDGADASRVEKTAVIARWPDAYSRLRVCWRPAVFNGGTGIVENCCQCEKCVRTMLSLDLLGAIDRFPTFPHPLRRRDVWRTTYLSVPSLVFWRENLTLARRAGRWDRVFDLRWARLRSRLARLKARLLGR